VSDSQLGHRTLTGKCLTDRFAGHCSRQDFMVVARSKFVLMPLFNENCESL